jgi:diamine N-acetyltransferase
MTTDNADTVKTAERLPVTLRPVTVHNWERCVHLRLLPAQAAGVASNLYSLAEAYVQPSCSPRAIYAGNHMIGFVMTEFVDSEGAYNIPRFMIDVDWQSAGYGGAALRAVLQALKNERVDAPILISLTPENQAARRLYERHGFEDTGQRLHGEDVLRHP